MLYFGSESTLKREAFGLNSHGRYELNEVFSYHMFRCNFSL